MKLNVNVLIIGALGHWSKKTYLPVFSSEKYDGQLFLCDIKGLALKLPSNYKYIKIRKNNLKDVNTLKNIIKSNNIKIVIISTPPEWHYFYLFNLKDCGVNFICDKPLIADVVDSNYSNKEILGKYLELQQYKHKQGFYIFTPLRRKLQSFYKKMYDEVSFISLKYGQNVTLVNIYENDGVHRWNDEMELDFCHGYGSGLGKLSHTGYHILDILSEIIKKGCSNIKNISCECLDCDLVRDNEKSKTNRIIKNMIGAKSKKVELNENTCLAELNITLKYTIRYLDDNPTYCYLFLRHGGVSNRTTKHYDEKNTGDDGRTDDSNFIIEQGALQNIFGTIISNSTEDVNAKSTLHIKRSINVFNQDETKTTNEGFEINNIEEMNTKTIVWNILNCIKEHNFEKYKIIEYDNQFLSMELYVAALEAKKTGKIITWGIGRLYDNLS